MGIIGLLCLRVYIDGVVWYLDVGLLYFGVEECNGIREFDCEIDMLSRCESRF